MNSSSKKVKQIEDSVPLRTVTTSMALIGILSALESAEPPLWLSISSITACIIGSYVSYVRRYANNFIVKIWISVGILLMAALFFNEIFRLAQANISDARVPLTWLLMGLTGLHCFDLPRRRDLSVAALVGVTLITASATLSRELYFAIYVGSFLFLAACMFQLDCASRSFASARLYIAEEPPANPGNRFELEKQSISARFNLSDLKKTLLGFVLIFMCTLFCFSLIPRAQVGFMKQMYFSFSLPYQMQMNLMQAQGSQGHGTITTSPKAFFGFSEVLDTNYRGTLGDQVVLRIASSTGSYLRGMAYDVFDGKLWRMSQPKKTKTRLAQAGHIIDLSSDFHSFYRKIRYKNLMQIIYVEEEGSNLVVYANIPYQIYFPATSVDIDNYGGIRCPAGMQKDLVYTVSSHIPIFNYQILRQLPEEDEHPQEIIPDSYLQTPQSLAPEVNTLANEIAEQGNNFVRAERLCRYLQTHYKYDLEVTPAPVHLDTVSHFLLHSKTGFCEHFASALAIMCRTQNIPARLVTGYAPGQFNPFTGFWDVRLNDAHSWVEVFVPGAGWVPLDATPDGLMTHSLQEQSTVFDYIGKSLSPVWEKLNNSALFKSTGKVLEESFEWLGAGVAALSSGLGAAIIVTLSIALTFTALALLRRFKLFPQFNLNFPARKVSPNKVKESIDIASKEYLAVSKTLLQLGVERKPSETSEELLGRVRRTLGVDRHEREQFVSTLNNFVDLYSDIRFGAGASETLPELIQMSSSLQEMSKKLSDKTKKTAISKSSC